MSWNLTQHDKRLSDSVILIMSGGVNPVSDFPTGRSRIRFQFPPIIKDESKKIAWKEDGAGKIIYEPLYFQFSAFPREISLTATYIVGGPTTTVEWTAVNVARELRQWKSYFYNNSSKGDLPTFLLEMYQHCLTPAGRDGFTTAWRGTNISFKYSDALVTDVTNGTQSVIGNTFPLRTDVTLKLSLTSRIKNSEGEQIFDLSGASPPRKPVMPQDWY